MLTNLVRPLASAAFFIALPAVAYADKIAIVDATVFDATGAAPYVATVVISDGIIESVTPGGKAPRGAEVIRAKGLALLPGFFDLHAHYTPSGTPGTAPQISQAYVASGVTTVNDFHQQPEAYVGLRAWYPSLPGPHVNFAARMSTTGGHGADWGDTNTTKWVNTAFAGKEAVGELIPYKPDVIKAFADGWRYGSGVDNSSMDLPTLSAIVEASKAANMPVLTHTVTVERGKIAAKAGVSVIAHSMQDALVDQELIDLLLASGTAYAPTLAVYEPLKVGQPQPSPRDQTFQIRKERFALSLSNVKTLHDAGVRIALATDAGMAFTPHGASTLREMELLVSAGLTPTDALLAGTVNSAKALGQIDRGTIEVGKRADLVLIDGKPWEDITAVRKTVRTFVDGKTMFGKGAPKPVMAKQPPTVVLASALVADFERPDGRTAVGSLPLQDVDRGKERSIQVPVMISRPGGGKALSLQARMALRDQPFTEVVLPLTPGSVSPVDVRAYKGVKFDLRGDGEYRFGVVGSSGLWAKTVAANESWATYEVPFQELVTSTEGGSWTGTDLISVRFAIQREPGETAWLEIDNVTFY